MSRPAQRTKGCVKLDFIKDIEKELNQMDWTSLEDVKSFMETIEKSLVRENAIFLPIILELLRLIRKGIKHSVETTDNLESRVRMSLTFPDKWSDHQ